MAHFASWIARFALAYEATTTNDRPRKRTSSFCRVTGVSSLNSGRRGCPPAALFFIAALSKAVTDFLPGCPQKPCVLLHMVAAVRNFLTRWRVVCCTAPVFKYAVCFPVLLGFASETQAQPRLSSGDCVRIASHQPQPDVTFQPGVDVAGRRVAPADLAPPVKVLPDRLWFVLSVDLARRLGSPLVGDLPLGIVSIENGRVLFNGQPLAPGDHASLEAACRSARR